ncbi:MAG: ubiquinol-cytochrome c reductase iron-sulfur subunit [Roseimicrobium sp.]
MNSECMTRREVARQFTLGMASWWASGVWTSQPVLAESTPGRFATDATLTLPITAFPVLANHGGSVRLEVGIDQPIIISRAADVFYAVGTICTHAGFRVNIYNAAQGAIQCPCHGSQYFIDGTVKAGPAGLPLNRYITSFDGTQLQVTLPGAAYSARDIQLVSSNAGTMRLKLRFYPEPSTSYQVHFTLSPLASGQAVPFSLTAGGAATQTTYTNTRTTLGPIVDLYVDVTGSSGFFSIVFVPQQV